MYLRHNLGNYVGLQQTAITVKPLYRGFVSPVDMVFSKYTYIADQAGQIIVVDPAGKQPQKIALDLAPIFAKLKPVSWRSKPGLSPKYDERGLLGIALHPDFPSNPRIYVYYSHPTSKKEFNHLSRLSVFKFDGWDNIRPDTEKVLLEIDQEAHSHNGGGMHFGPDGCLYLSLGDGLRRKYKKGEMGHAQNITTPKGSILRINVSNDTATAPPDNPLVKVRGANPFIWVYGLRNPWRFSFDRATNRCFVGNVGESKNESIYQVKHGDNCGWRIFEGSHLQDPLLLEKLGIHPHSITMPIFDYGPDLGRSVIGGFVYRGKRPDLQGLYIFADASITWPWRAFLQGPKGAIYALKETAKGWERASLKINGLPKQLITSVAEDNSGELYILTRSKFGVTGQTGVVSKLI